MFREGVSCDEMIFVVSGEISAVIPPPYIRRFPEIPGPEIVCLERLEKGVPDML